MISIFKLLFKNPEKKKVTREKKICIKGNILPFISGNIICRESSTTLWASEVKTMVYYSFCVWKVPCAM